MLADGHNYRTAAGELGVSVNTVSFHMKSVYEKLQVHSKSEAVAKALKQRLEMENAYLQQEIQEYYSNFRISNDLLELRNLADVAALIIRSAQQRRESRGLHYTLDYPEPETGIAPQDTILTPDLPKEVDIAM